MKYTIGLDFGTSSARGVIVSCDNGDVLASAIKKYRHGVMDTHLIHTGEVLPSNWALQDPKDYIEIMTSIIPKIVKESGVSVDNIIGVGIDFTASTVMPIDEEGTPLCNSERFKDNKHAYVKLWKHHGAQDQANKINYYLGKMGLADEPIFGGRVSSELLLPKLMEVMDEAPEIFDNTDEFLEAGDWLTRLLTGSNRRSNSMAGYKMWWNDGYPDNQFFAKLDNRLDGIVKNKVPGEVVKVGNSIGSLAREWAEKLGLRSGIAVAPTIIDSHAGVPGSGLANKGQALLVLGTSSVLIGFSEEAYSKYGIMGAVKDAIIPGYYAYESGSAAVGDLYQWFLDNMFPYSYYQEAQELNQDLFVYLNNKVEEQNSINENLFVLDWWSGNKTPYVDGNLKGSIIGLDLTTKPEEIYRAIVESSAFGTKRIMDLYEENGVEINEILCIGGIAKKNPLIVQIFADILKKPLKIIEDDQTTAIGSAIYGALAAGKESGGFDDYEKAVETMSSNVSKIVQADARYNTIYLSKYLKYKDLCKKMISEVNI